MKGFATTKRQVSLKCWQNSHFNSKDESESLRLADRRNLRIRLVIMGQTQEAFTNAFLRKHISVRSTKISGDGVYFVGKASRSCAL